MSLVVHAAVIALLVVHGRELVERAAGGPGPRGGGEGAVTFFVAPASRPAVLDLPAPAPIKLAALPSLQQLKLNLPPLALPHERLAPPVPGAVGATGGTGQGPGGRAGTEARGGTGVGPDEGPGTGGEGGYIFPAHPRRVIPRLPACLSPGALEVRFWVAADGRPTRVEIDPPPRDEGCRRAFMNLMLETRFYPATKHGQAVASVYSIRYSRGN